MKKRNKVAAAAVFAVLTMTSGLAQGADRLTELLGHELDAAMSGMRSCPQASSSADAQEWYLRRFWLRIRLKGNTQIAGFGKLEIVPEIELLAERDLPAGWEPYKP